VSLIVLADQGSADDTFTGRALSGESGQQLQGFLRAAGLTKRYLVLRSLPVDTLDLSAAKRRAVAGNARVLAFHRELLRRLRQRNPNATALLAMGPVARHLAPSVAPTGLDVIEMAAPGEPGAAGSWQAALTRLASRTYPTDLAAPTFTVPTGRSQLPRIDLPYGTPRWVGTSGDRGLRPIDLDTGKPTPDYLKLFLPTWVAGLGPAPLSPAERLAAESLT
jgi:hypothetical protein